MTALLHDLAKPSTAKVVGDRLRFFITKNAARVWPKKSWKNCITAGRICA